MVLYEQIVSRAFTRCIGKFLKNDAVLDNGPTGLRERSTICLRNRAKRSPWWVLPEIEVPRAPGACLLIFPAQLCQNGRSTAIVAYGITYMKHFLFLALIGLAAVMSASSALAASNSDVIGEVKTSTNILGPNDTIGVIRFEDPKVAGAYCYLASAQKGGMAANFGMQESPSEYELSCFADGVVHIPANLPDKEIVDEANRSAVFKKMYVARFIDRQTHRLIYVAYTRYLLDGSPKHAMSSLSYTP